MSLAAGRNSPVLKQQKKQKIHKSKEMNKCQASRAASHLSKVTLNAYAFLTMHPQAFDHFIDYWPPL